MFTYKLRGFSEFQAKLKKSPQTLKTLANMMLMRAGDTVQVQARTKVPHFNNDLKNSIHRSDPSNFSVRVGTNLNYARAQEEGFPPGYVFPNYKSEVFRKWVGAKLGDPKLTYIVARKIYMKGMKGHKYMKHGFDYIKKNIDDVYQLGRELIKHLSF